MGLAMRLTVIQVPCGCAQPLLPDRCRECALGICANCSADEGICDRCRREIEALNRAQARHCPCCGAREDRPCACRIEAADDHDLAVGYQRRVAACATHRCRVD